MDGKSSVRDKKSFIWHLESRWCGIYEIHTNYSSDYINYLFIKLQFLLQKLGPKESSYSFNVWIELIFQFNK